MTRPPRLWFSADAEFACPRCLAAYPNNLATPFGGSLWCHDPGCPLVADPEAYGLTTLGNPEEPPT